MRSQADQDARVEDYLDHIYAPMVGRLPYKRRVELRREMRSHISQLVAAHEELGSDRGEAVTAALRQFGAPSVVAARWLDQLPCELASSSAKHAAQGTVGAFQFAAKRLAISIAIWVTIGVVFDRQISGSVPASLYILLGASLPCLTGYLVGRRHSHARPELAMLAAQAAVIPFWPAFMMWLMSTFNHVTPDPRTGAIMGAISFCSLAPIGCLSAWLGRLQSRREARRRGIA